MEPDFLGQLPEDSLDRVELVMALEEKLNIEIPDDEARKFRTVQDLLDYLERRQKAEKRRKGGDLN